MNQVRHYDVAISMMSYRGLLVVLVRTTRSRCRFRGPHLSIPCYNMFEMTWNHPPFRASKREMPRRKTFPTSTKQSDPEGESKLPQYILKHTFPSNEWPSAPFQSRIQFYRMTHVVPPASSSLSRDARSLYLPYYVILNVFFCRNSRNNILDVPKYLS